MKKNEKLRLFLKGILWRERLMFVNLLPFFLLGLCMMLQVSVQAQTVKVSVDFKDKTLNEVLVTLSRVSKCDIFYGFELVQSKGQKVTLKAENRELGSILKELLPAYDLYHTYDGHVVVIREKAINTSKIPERVRIHGVVMDEKKVPIPGVTVRLKGASAGTATDKDGKFLFIYKQSKDIVLIFSFIGMKTQEVKYTGQDTMRVILREDLMEMDEVVITGYQTIDKRHLTSAVTSLKAENIKVSGMNSIDQMLEGNVPGMIFMQNSGQVGAVPKLRIRGSSTVLGNREPLWVIDGVVQYDPVAVDPSQLNDPDFVNLLGNAISGLNPEDIEQIDVLKDASATALYGVKAANGVIVITTKKGRVGPPSVGYSLTTSFQRRPYYSDRDVNVMNSAERIEFSRELMRNLVDYPMIDTWVGYEAATRDYYNGDLSFTEYQKEVSNYEKMNTDWFGILTRNTFSHNHTLSISGGSQNMRYYTSVGYSDMGGVIKGESNQRYTANIKLNINHERFSMQFGLNGNFGIRKYIPSEIGVLNYAYEMSRAVPLYNEDGSLLFYQKSDVNSEDGKNFYRYNVLNEINNSDYNHESSQMGFNANLNYNFTRSLKANVTFSYSLSYSEQENYYSGNSFYASTLRGAEIGQEVAYKSKLPSGGELKEIRERGNNYMLRGQLDYNKILDKEQKHNIGASFGAEINSSHRRGNSRTIRGYVPERGLLINPVDYKKYTAYVTWLTTDPSALGVRTDELTNTAGVYFSAFYNYKNLYSFNFNTRMDASNKFGEQSNDKMLPVWSVSGRWNIAEDLFSNVAWVNDLNMRASFGYQGNMLGIGPELVIEKGELNPNHNKYGSTVFNYPNPNLKWEKTLSVNGQVDFAFFRNRLVGSVSYFYKHTTDAYISKSVSEVNGVSTYTVNQGELTNSGLEFSFNLNPIVPKVSINGQSDGFRWSIDPQLGSVVNKLVNKLKNNREKVLKDDVKYSDYLKGTVEIPGEPLNTFYSYKFTGLNPENGLPMFANCDEFTANGVDNKIRFEGMGKEEVFREIMVKSGRREPFLQGSVVNTFSYKGFVLNFKLDYSFGAKVRLLRLYDNVVKRYGTIAPQPHVNVRKEFANRWRNPGDERYTNMPGIVSGSEFARTMIPWWKGQSYAFADNIWQMYDDSDMRVVSGNYLKLTNISLRYNIPVQWLKKCYMKSAYVSLTGVNLFTLCHKDLKGQDPNQSGTSPRINLSLRPTYSLTLNVSF